MEELTQITNFDISYNNINEFNVNVLYWKRLASLSLISNNISIHNEGIWKHPQLINLDLSNNNGFRIPLGEREIDLPQLIYLNMLNNSVVIPEKLGIDELPIVKDLFLVGNYMSKFPENFNTFKTQLYVLGVSHCSLSELPDYLNEFTNLIYLDARNNSISKLSSNLKSYLQQNGEKLESYFAGNPLCDSFSGQQTAAAINCKPICSDYCWSERTLNNGICDVTCNSHQCNFDGGDCIVKE